MSTNVNPADDPGSPPDSVHRLPLKPGPVRLPDVEAAASVQSARTGGNAGIGVRGTLAIVYVIVQLLYLAQSCS